MPRVSAVLFDMDGTLLRLDISNAAMDRAREELRALFLEAGVDAVFRPVLRVIRESLGELARRGSDVASIRRRAYGTLDAMELDGARRATPCPDAAATLEALHRAGRRLGLVTNNGGRCVGRALDAAGLSPALFSAIVSRDDVPLEKPHAEPLLCAVEHLGLDPGAVTVMVGDRPDDMRSARALAGYGGERPVFTIGMGADLDRRRHEWPELLDYYADGLAEIPDIVGALDHVGHAAPEDAASSLGGRAQKERR